LLRPVFIIENDHEMLHQGAEIVEYKEGIEIAKHILDNVIPTYACYGLAANQLGINAAVAVIKVNEREPIFLINPKITNLAEPMRQWDEGCLSYPGDKVKILRYKTIQYDNMVGKKKYANEIGLHSDYNHLLETVAIQHEIDHLCGITIYDRQIKPTTRLEPKVSRNAPCPCGSGKKYKRCCLK